MAESLTFGGLEKGLDFEAQLVALSSSDLNLGLNLLEGFAQGLDLLELELGGFSEVSSGEEKLKSEDEGWNEGGAESQGGGMAEGLEEPVGDHGGIIRRRWGDGATYLVAGASRFWLGGAPP